MGGGIAFVADIVGKKLGKKRLSIGGLRPRHTAAVGTILVGVLITTVTIAVVLITSAPVRQALLEGAKIRRDLEEDQQKLTKLEGQVNDRSTQNSKLTSQNGILSKTIGDKTKELALRQKELKDAQTRLAALRIKIVSLQSKIFTLKSDVSKKILALHESDRKLNLANGSLSRVQANLRKVQHDLSTNKVSLTRVEKDNQDIERKNAELVTANDELQKAQKSLQQNIDSLQKAKEVVQSDLAKSQSDLAEVSGQLSDEKRKLASTQVELQKAESDFEQMHFISSVSRSQPMIFKVGEEVVRSTVPPGLSVSAARGALTNLIRRAQAEAHRRGALRHIYPEAAIVEHDDPQTNQTITPEMIEQNIVKQIAGTPTRKVLIATSSLNAFRGESVSLEIVVMPDPLVYINGQKVAETVIDGSRGDIFIFDQLTTFLQTGVKTRAQKDGMIPVAKGDVAFGSVSQADVFQVIEQLHNANRTIRLEAHASGDIYASDPLKLEFRLR